MAADSHKMAQGSLGLPVNKNGEFLITLRNEPQHPETHNKWQVAGGGIEFGETPEQALAREMQEELSVSVRLLYPQPIAKTRVWRLNNGSYHILLLCYLVDIGIQTPKVDGEENLEYRWIKPADIHVLEYLPLTDDFIFEAETLIKRHNLLAKIS